MKQNKIPRNEYIIKPKGKTNPYKDDVVYSNLGQWKYPGQVTKIPSNQITMQGVNYPVQGIDDTGYSQMMYPGMDYTFPGEYVTEYPMAQNGAQVEDNDSWLENIGEIVDPTGLSSWDDVYRAYKNSGLSKETALESFGAIPLLGKISKVTKPGLHLTKYSGLDKILKNTLPRNKSLSRAANVSSKMGIGTDAIQAVVGSKDDSGFTWDLRHGEVPKYDGRNIFPQIDLGEHGDFAYGGSSDMYPFGGIHTKTDTHMATGGWLDSYEPGGEKPWGDMTAKERAAYLKNKEIEQKKPGYKPITKTEADIEANQAETVSRKQATKEHYQDYVKDSMKKTLEHPMFNTAQYFTPEGMAIGAIKGLANVGPDVAKGDYSAAAFDALTVLPGVPSSVKYKIKDSSEYLKALGKGYLEPIPKKLKYKINNYSDLKKIPKQYKNSLEEMTSPEGLARLKNLGVDDPDDFIKFVNNVKKTAINSDSQYLNINQGAINVNPSQVKKFKKTLVPLATNQNAIDHEYGHMIQHYLEGKGKTYKGLTDLDIEAADELLPHLNKETSDFFKTTIHKDPKTGSKLAEENNQKLAWYFFKGGKGTEPLAHLRETKRAMKEAKIINDIHESVTPEHIKNYIEKTGNKDRITSFLKNTPEANKSLANLLNKTPALLPIGLGAAALQQEKLGGWLDEQFRRGGQKGLKSYTSKNIQSSVNDIMLRNETLFGPAGKKRYKANVKYKDGGNWLDNMY